MKHKLSRPLIRVRSNIGRNVFTPAKKMKNFASCSIIREVSLRIQPGSDTSHGSSEEDYRIESEQKGQAQVSTNKAK
jgi:hypothetical protein